MKFLYYCKACGKKFKGSQSTATSGAKLHLQRMIIDMDARKTMMHDCGKGKFGIAEVIGIDND